LKLVFISLGRH